MRFWTVFSFLAALAALLMGCTAYPGGARQPSGVISESFANSPPSKIAIFVEKYTGARYSPRDVEDTMTIGLMRKGYTVASRSDVETITKEQGFQNSGMTDSDAARMGKMLNVPAAMIVTVKNLKVNRYRNASKVDGSMGARLISVSGGEVLWINTVNYRPYYYATGSDDTAPAVQVMAAELVSSFPSRSTAPK